MLFIGTISLFPNSLTAIISSGNRVPLIADVISAEFEANLPLRTIATSKSKRKNISSTTIF